MNHTYEEVEELMKKYENKGALLDKVKTERKIINICKILGFK
jgi:hypothetical protein